MDGGGAEFRELGCEGDVFLEEKEARTILSGGHYFLWGCSGSHGRVGLPLALGWFCGFLFNPWLWLHTVVILSLAVALSQATPQYQLVIRMSGIESSVYYSCFREDRGTTTSLPLGHHVRDRDACKTLPTECLPS